MVKQKMSGLSLFISDIRNCKCQEDELKRIYKELANIRAKFNNGQTLNGYNKKKYLCKLIFVFLLGHEFDIGLLEAINLVNSNKYSEKFIGYLFLSVIMNEKTDLALLVENAVKNDLMSDNQIHQNLALQYAANMANESMALNISKIVLNIFYDTNTKDNVKQSAILCLYRIYKTDADAIDNKHLSETVANLILHSNLGLAIVATSLLEAIVMKNKFANIPIVSNIVSKLESIAKASVSDFPDYIYYLIPAPWLTIKLLKLLRCFTISPKSAVEFRLIICIELILNKCQQPYKSKQIAHKNSRNAVMFEIILVIHHIKIDGPLIMRACNILNYELNRKEYNLRYLALETMCLLSEYHMAKEQFKEHFESIKESLFVEGDYSIRQKASDLLFTICDNNNVEDIIQELFNSFSVNETTKGNETALKIAILAEIYCENLEWYVDIILTLLRNFKKCVSHEIWYRLIQNIIKNDSIKSYASKRLFDTLQKSNYNENLVVVAAYILGEFGYLIAGDPASNSKKQLDLLQKYFDLSSSQTKYLLLTTYLKFSNMFPDIRNDIRNIFKANASHSDVEIQQRSWEYLKLSETAILSFVAQQIPVNNKHQSLVQIALQKIRPDLCKMQISNDNYTSLTSERQISKSYSVTNYKGNIETVKRCVVENPEKILKKPENSYTEILANVFSEPKSVQRNDSKKNILEPFNNFIWQNKLIIFDNQFLEVTAHSIFRKHQGRILLIYNNKAINPFRNFLPCLLFQDAMKFKIQMNPCPSIIFAGDSTHQEIAIDCLQEFSERPALTIGFVCASAYCEFPLKLPVTLNKFFEPVLMDSQSFREKWNNLNAKKNELIKILRAKQPIDNDMLSVKLTGMGIAVLSNISKNADDIFGAGIFHCQTYQIGLLIRIQSNVEVKKYRLIIRSAKGTILEELSRLIDKII